MSSPLSMQTPSRPPPPPPPRTTTTPSASPSPPRAPPVSISTPNRFDVTPSNSPQHQHLTQQRTSTPPALSSRPTRQANAANNASLAAAAPTTTQGTHNTSVATTVNDNATEKHTPVSQFQINTSLVEPTPTRFPPSLANRPLPKGGGHADTLLAGVDDSWPSASTHHPKTLVVSSVADVSVAPTTLIVPSLISSSAANVTEQHLLVSGGGGGGPSRGTSVTSSTHFYTPTTADRHQQRVRATQQPARARPTTEGTSHHHDASTQQQKSSLDSLSDRQSHSVAMPSPPRRVPSNTPLRRRGGGGGGDESPLRHVNHGVNRQSIIERGSVPTQAAAGSFTTALNNTPIRAPRHRAVSGGGSRSDDDVANRHPRQHSSHNEAGVADEKGVRRQIAPAVPKTRAHSTRKREATHNRHHHRGRGNDDGGDKTETFVITTTTASPAATVYYQHPNPHDVDGSPVRASLLDTTSKPLPLEAGEEEAMVHGVTAEVMAHHNASRHDSQIGAGDDGEYNDSAGGHSVPIQQHHQTTTTVTIRTPVAADDRSSLDHDHADTGGDVSPRVVPSVIITSKTVTTRKVTTMRSSSADRTQRDCRNGSGGSVGTNQTATATTTQPLTDESPARADELVLPLPKPTTTATTADRISLSASAPATPFSSAAASTIPDTPPHHSEDAAVPSPATASPSAAGVAAAKRTTQTASANPRRRTASITHNNNDGGIAATTTVAANHVRQNNKSPPHHSAPMANAAGPTMTTTVLRTHANISNTTTNATTHQTFLRSSGERNDVEYCYVEEEIYVEENEEGEEAVVNNEVKKGDDDDHDTSKNNTAETDFVSSPLVHQKTNPTNHTNATTTTMLSSDSIMAAIRVSEARPETLVFQRTPYRRSRREAAVDVLSESQSDNITEHSDNDDDDGDDDAKGGEIQRPHSSSATRRRTDPSLRRHPRPYRTGAAVLEDTLNIIREGLGGGDDDDNHLNQTPPTRTSTTRREGSNNPQKRQTTRRRTSATTPRTETPAESTASETTPRSFHIPTIRSAGKNNNEGRREVGGHHHEGAARGKTATVTILVSEQLLVDAADSCAFLFANDAANRNLVNSGEEGHHHNTTNSHHHHHHIMELLRRAPLPQLYVFEFPPSLETTRKKGSDAMSDATLSDDDGNNSDSTTMMAILEGKYADDWRMITIGELKEVVLGEYLSFVSTTHLDALLRQNFGIGNSAAVKKGERQATTTAPTPLSRAVFRRVVDKNASSGGDNSHDHNREGLLVSGRHYYRFAGRDVGGGGGGEEGGDFEEEEEVAKQHNSDQHNQKKEEESSSSKHRSVSQDSTERRVGLLNEAYQKLKQRGAAAVNGVSIPRRTSAATTTLPSASATLPLVGTVVSSRLVRDDYGVPSASSSSLAETHTLGHHAYRLGEGHEVLTLHVHRVVDRNVWRSLAMLDGVVGEGFGGGGLESFYLRTSRSRSNSPTSRRHDNDDTSNAAKKMNRVDPTSTRTMSGGPKPTAPSASAPPPPRVVRTASGNVKTIGLKLPPPTGALGSAAADKGRGYGYGDVSGGGVHMNGGMHNGGGLIRKTMVRSSSSSIPSSSSAAAAVAPSQQLRHHRFAFHSPLTSNEAKQHGRGRGGGGGGGLSGGNDQLTANDLVVPDVASPEPRYHHQTPPPPSDGVEPTRAHLTMMMTTPKRRSGAAAGLPPHHAPRVGGVAMAGSSSHAAHGGGADDNLGAVAAESDDELHGVAVLSRGGGEHVRGMVNGRSDGHQQTTQRRRAFPLSIAREPSEQQRQRRHVSPLASAVCLPDHNNHFAPHNGGGGVGGDADAEYRRRALKQQSEQRRGMLVSPDPL